MKAREKPELGKLNRTDHGGSCKPTYEVWSLFRRQWRNIKNQSCVLDDLSTLLYRIYQSGEKINRIARQLKVDKAKKRCSQN